MSCESVGPSFHSDFSSDIPPVETSSLVAVFARSIFLPCVLSPGSLGKTRSNESLKKIIVRSELTKTPHYQEYSARIPTRPLNSEHSLLYAPKYQGRYEEQFRSGVVRIWQELNDLRSKEFRSQEECDADMLSLIKNVGKLRRGIAKRCHHENPEKYGAIRSKKSKTRVAPDGPYSGYLDRYIEGGQIVGFFSDQALILTSHIASRKLGYKLCHEAPEHPLTQKALAYHLHAAIDCPPEEVHDRIATFHWWMANVIPFERGSGACAEMITAALWLSHGLVPPEFPLGISPDCEALCQPDLEEYLKWYPHGTSTQVFTSSSWSS